MAERVPELVEERPLVPGGNAPQQRDSCDHLFMQDAHLVASLFVAGRI